MSKRTLIRVFVATVAAGAIVSGASLPAQATTGLQVTTTPGLYPAFSTGVSDYVVRCQPSTPVSVSVTVPANTEVIVDNQPGKTTSFTTSVSISSGQSFSITSIGLDGSGTNTYFVRCLPTDYPNFTSQKLGSPQAAYYVVKPSTLALFSNNPPQQYITIFNTDGVPVWWTPDGPGFDAGILPNGNLVSIVQRTAPHIIVHRLDGTIAAGLSAANALGTTGFYSTDGHDVQLLPNGDYLTAEITTSQGDLSFMGGPSNATISDQVLEELTPSGSLVWSWDTASHIPLTETDPEWYSTILNPTGPALAPGYDNYHFNSIQEIGNDVLVSYRALDAVFMIDKTTGKIIWKLGGSKTPQSLTIVGDSVFTSGSGFGGQHYARFYGGSTNAVTIHDNGTGRGRGPRGVRYAIDLKHHTATLQESVNDPSVTSSACCGNAAKLPGGDWVASWGFTPVVEELNPAGVRQFLLQWTDAGVFSYRAEPVLPGVLSISALRSGMNTQYPR